MKVSLNIVKKLTGIEFPDVDVLVERINRQLGGVEEVIDLRQKYKDAKIVRVVECEKHPNADKLSVCKIDIGGDDLVQVVCGAPNARADMFAIWLPPDSIVPSTFEDDEPFVLGARELRGVMSHGMLAAADELAIGTDHRGIIEITEEDIRPTDSPAKIPELDSLAGASFAEVFGLDDVIIDIENKMFTHRPDLFGQLGVAREISAILQDSAAHSEFVDNHFVNPDWYWLRPEFSKNEGLKLEVFNEASEASPRFMAVAIKNVEVAESPVWLKCQLVSMGSKPINNIVDWTNYVMLMTAQPTHAYDYDKLRGQKIGVRMAKPGEKAKLLNEKNYELTDEDIVIADAEGVIGLAGVMGGFESEVTDETKNIVLEVANFNMYKVRKSSMRYGLFTDAVTRFNKGQSPLQTDRVVKRLLELLPGEQASKVYDLHVKPTDLNEASIHGEVLYSVDFINQRLGTDFTADQIGNILRPVNITTYPSGEDPDALSSTAPFWRTDVELPEDIVEEVGRLYGFDKLNRYLPVRSAKPTPKNSRRLLKQKIRDSLSRSGSNEVLTYSFVHENILKLAQQDSDQAFRLNNALSPDLQYYRLGVLPSLLSKVHANIKSGHSEFALFEIGKSHNKRLYDKDGLPTEHSSVDAVYTSKDPKVGAAFYQIRRIIDRLVIDLGLQVVYRQATEEDISTQASSFDPSRTAVIETYSGAKLGYVGELKQQVRRNFKLPDYTAAMTISMELLQQFVDLAKSSDNYKPLSRYPSISQDISLKVKNDVSYKSLVDQVNNVLGSSAQELVYELTPISVYQPEDDSSTKTITLSLRFTSHAKTLKDKDISIVMSNIAKATSDVFGALVV